MNFSPTIQGPKKDLWVLSLVVDGQPVFISFHEEEKAKAAYGSAVESMTTGDKSFRIEAPDAEAVFICSHVGSITFSKR